jgi:HPt (histidine-containing phosphotransfer) domain-containing protein
MLAALWEKNRPLLLSRLDLLDQAAAAEPLPQAQRDEAASVAHKLAGSLGMFGYRKGTELARELERGFEANDLDRNRLQELTGELRRAVTGEPG